MAESHQPPIIIKKVKGGGGHGGSHGAWKVAYADFTTAMMSFFLLLWLLNTTTSDQRQGIADYFAPASISSSNSGAGGAMGGKTITADGTQVANGAPPTPDEETVPTAGKGAEGEEDVPGKAENAADQMAKMQGQKDAGEKAAGEKAEGDKGAGKVDLNDPEALAAAMAKEEERFKQAEELLRKTIEGSPELHEFADQILFDRTNEGLRIQIVDRDNSSMFPSGSSILFEKSRNLLRLVGKVLSRLPNRITVTGHTDSQPFTAGSRRDNWDLSTERANVSRYELVHSGVDDGRIARVVGQAEKDPLIPANPKDPRNRRISIVLLRMTASQAEGSKPVAESASQALPTKIKK
jgi:chemotaxis protein MotB